MYNIVLQNLSITILSKLLSFISFLYIAKLLSPSEYGILVYINMILSLLPMLQLGSMHGIAILLPKKIAEKNGSENVFFLVYNTFSHLLQFLSAIFLLFIDVMLNKFIVVIIALNFVLSKYLENVQIYLSSHLEFQKLNIIKTFDQIIRPVSVLILFTLYKTIESIFIAQFTVSILTFMLSYYFVKLKINLPELKIIKNILKEIYFVGFFIYLTWVIDILFRTADIWFISQFYTLEELATYGFVSSLALNIWLLAMSFFSPYSQLLYKYVAEGNFVEAKKVVENTNKKLYVLLSIISITAVVLYPILLRYFIHKYFGTELLFIILVLTSIFLSINNMYIYYMISNKLYFALLKSQVSILLLNIFLNSVFAFLHLPIFYFSLSTILSLFIYFLLVKRAFYIDINKKLGGKWYEKVNEGFTSTNALSKI